MMRPIRSLLWIGTGRGLAESGVTEAPELDVTWVPDPAAAATLPRVLFDGALVETTTIEPVADCVKQLRDHFGEIPILIAAPRCLESRAEEFLDLGAAAAFFVEPNEQGPGIVSHVSEALDLVHESRRDSIAATCVGAGATAIASVNTPNQARRDPSAANPPAPESGETTTAGDVGDAASRVLTRSPAMVDVFKLVRQAASSPSTVLVTGETGVGKEVVAHALHDCSVRGDAPFVAINCAAFPETLLESELFGHVKGAFTGADRAKQGLFEAAGAGTLFLDEIAETSLPLQAKLLRVLQEREIRPVGGTQHFAVRCRIIAATNRILSEEVERGGFREDLFYRLNVFPIRIPPLRGRTEEILPLARHFLALHGPREGKIDCHLSLASSQLLQTYGWPGNVRELENEVLRMLMLTPSGQLITPKSLSPKITEILEPIAHDARPNETLKEALDRVEAWMIRRALANNDRRRARTAKKLGLTREGLYKKMKRLSIE